MSKVRIYTLAKELGMDNAHLLEMLDTLGVEYKSHSSTLEDDLVATIKEMVLTERAGTAAPVAVEAVVATAVVAPTPAVAAPVPDTSIPVRAPVVTIMGHVDHGKTSLLDYIRKTKVAAKEAGGITQHVGAFEAMTNQGKIVFVDTPGHEAFTTIRARGAKVADIAIIVVAADDSIMPQTREAIAHAQAANVPIIVAINKIDLPQANPDKVMLDLTQVNLVPVEYGGSTEVLRVSAKTGEGVDDLLEMIAFMADGENLRADPNGPFSGVVISSKVDKQSGVMTNIMVQHGSLEVGDFLVVGESYGKVKAMNDSVGAKIKKAGPSTPVQILGFSEGLHPGDTVFRTDSERAAREMIENRGGDRRDQENALLAIKRERPTLAELMGALEEMREVNLILRADTQESLEAIKYILEKYTEDDVKVNIMMAGIGAPNESDILLASTAGATILCFSVTAAGALQKAAEQRGIAIKSYRIVYELEQEVERLLKGTREPVFEEKYLGKAEVRMLIKHPKAGVVAGSYVQDGTLKRNSKAKVLRKGKIVYEGTIVGLKRFKDDVREVARGFECGINLDWEEILEGDIIEASEMVEVIVA